MLTPAGFCAATEVRATAAADDVAVLGVDPEDVLLTSGCYPSPLPLQFLSEAELIATCSDCAMGWKCDMTPRLAYPCTESGDLDTTGTPIRFVLPQCLPVAAL